MDNNISPLIYLPKNLYLRLTRRYSSKYFVIYYFFIIFIKIILGVLFLNAVYVTRNYLIDPDKFWEKTLKKDKYLSLQSYCAFTGIFLICSSIFSIMNNALIDSILPRKKNENNCRVKRKASLPINNSLLCKYVSTLKLLI